MSKSIDDAPTPKMEPRRFIVLLISVLFIKKEIVNCEEVCNSNLNINITVFREVYSESVNETVRGQIGYKKDLFHMIVRDNSIANLSENFVLIQNELSVLQLLNNSIGEINRGAFNITPSLSLLRISYNPLNKIEKGVFNNIKVKEIDLSDNQIAIIDSEAFDNNTSIEIVKLNNNHIKEINPDWFKNSPNVYKLSLVLNELSKIPPEAFKNMAQHRALKLRFSSNRIAEISADAFKNHANINLLRMNGNKLTSLDPNIFRNRTIAHLQVNTNRLSCFPDEMLRPPLKTIYFFDNSAFECACLKKVRKFAEENQVDVVYPSIICEDKSREVNIVFNYNKTYEIPLLPPSVDVDVYVKPEGEAIAT